jgi:hypothetical protein
MSFKTLEERFNENVDKLYANAKSKFENGRASTGRNDDPLIVRKPGDGYWNRAESRSIPIVSALNDVKRLTLFTLSTRGVLFLAKQQLLQTGNTFELTRTLNPAFVVANGVPFLHIKRSLRPLGDLLKKTDTSYDNVKKLGQLQVGTYENYKSKWVVPRYINFPGAKDKNKTSVFDKIKKFASTALQPITSAFGLNVKRNIGDKYGYTAAGWKKSRPEMDTMVKTVSKLKKGYQDAVGGYFKSELKEDNIKFLKYFQSPDGIVSVANGAASDNDSPKSIRGDRASIVRAATNNPRKISYIKDPSNNPRKSAQASVLQPYKQINHRFSDPVTVSFAMGKDDHIQFRAYIKNLQQTATPEYKNYQYIGRIEKFINYTGIQREISFRLGIIAFSKDELDSVWRRINYLTGLVYPYGFNKGILQPNVARLTIGSLYTDQPGYVQSLSTDFSELTESWDIDAKVPIGATMDIRFVIIEKATRIASSPFYGITDGDGRENRQPMDGFTKTIPIPEKKNQPANPATQAPKNSTAQQPTNANQAQYNMEVRDLNRDIQASVNAQQIAFEAEAFADSLKVANEAEEFVRQLNLNKSG